MIPRVKVCCITSVHEARLAVDAGASALGLVSEMPSGPGIIPDDLIAGIAAVVPPPVATFLLTARQDASSIVVQHEVCRTTAIQLVDEVPPGELLALRRQLRGIKLVQVIHVAGPQSVEQATSVAPFVDALLLDSGNLELPRKELGGTGRTHDWILSRTIRERCDKPVFLAGGLTPENVRDAISAVAPFGVDLCTGLRTDDRLDEAKLARFFAAVLSASAGKPITDRRSEDRTSL